MSMPLARRADGRPIFGYAGGAYDSLTSRSDAASLIPEQVSYEMLQTASSLSAVLALFTPVPVAATQVRFPILSALPVAYWVSGDTGLKQTTDMAWTNKYLNIEEIATIFPIPENVLADVAQGIWGQAQPKLVEAFARTLDSAVFFGTNAPGTFPTYIASAAVSAGNTVNEGTNNAAAGGYFGDLDDLHGTVEGDGFDVNGWVASTAFKSKLRKARDTQGRKLDEARTNGDLSVLDGYPVRYPMRGLWTTSSGSVRGFGGDWTQFVVGVRQDISMKLLDQAVITDSGGNIVYNLPQQDMVALRLTFRVGWQVANLINNDQPVEANRYPVGVIRVP